MIQQQLIFVYNANGDLFSTVTDFAHKILSPSTYDCHLCALTYGNFSEKEEWRSFIKSFDIKTSIIYKDEFVKQYKNQAELPAIFMQSENQLQQIISKEEIGQCRSIDELKNLILIKHKEYVQHHHTNI